MVLSPPSVAAVLNSRSRSSNSVPILTEALGIIDHSTTALLHLKLYFTIKPIANMRVYHLQVSDECCGKKSESQVEAAPDGHRLHKARVLRAFIQVCVVAKEKDLFAVACTSMCRPVNSPDTGNSLTERPKGS